MVSGAAGSVGSLACQIGKLYGAKVIGIAGTEEKCRWLREELKIDATLNYKSPTFRDEFKNEVGYLDVFFDNVGGEILDFALTRLKKGSRVTLCGELGHETDSTVLSYLTFARCHLRLQYVHIFWEPSSSDSSRCRCSQAKGPLFLCRTHNSTSKDGRLHCVCQLLEKVTCIAGTLTGVLSSVDMTTQIAFPRVWLSLENGFPRAGYCENTTLFRGWRRHPRHFPCSSQGEIRENCMSLRHFSRNSPF